MCRRGKWCASEEHAPLEGLHDNRYMDRLQAPSPPALSALPLHGNGSGGLQSEITVTIRTPEHTRVVLVERRHILGASVVFL